MTENNAEMARLLMAVEAMVEELDRQGLLQAVINLRFDPDQMAMAIIKAETVMWCPRGLSLCSLGTGLEQRVSHEPLREDTDHHDRSDCRGSCARWTTIAP
jgi:hypothetical protein